MKTGLSNCTFQNRRIRAPDCRKERKKCRILHIEKGGRSQMNWWPRSHDRNICLLSKSKFKWLSFFKVFRILDTLFLN